MNAIAVQREESAPMPDGAALIEVIRRAASDPAVDIEKMERLLLMQERVTAKRAETEFASALAEMQLELPSIGERGGIKDRAGNVQSTYALWEDINEAIKPVMQKFGFALSFRVADRDNKTIVTGVLSHRSGHRETTDITLPADTSGSKNAVQAIGSSVSYGKRYAASALLNLTSHGEDDDGKTAAKKAKADTSAAGRPQDGMRVDDLPEEDQPAVRRAGDEMNDLCKKGSFDAAAKMWKELKMPQEHKAAVWFLLSEAHYRTALTKLLKG